MRKETGGQAFPSRDSGGNNIRGMTLRDWFAGQALNALLFNPIAVETMLKVISDGEEEPGELVSEAAYQMADYMLKERGNE